MNMWRAQMTQSQTNSVLPKSSEVHSCKTKHYHISEQLDASRALWDASCDGDVTVVNKLLAIEGLNVNLKHMKNCTAPHNASEYLGNGVVKTLLNANRIHVNRANRGKITPLHVACEHGHTDVVKALLSADGIHVNPTTNKEATPLHVACKHGHTDVVKALLSVDGIGINAWDTKGNYTAVDCVLRGPF